MNFINCCTETFGFIKEFYKSVETGKKIYSRNHDTILHQRRNRFCIYSGDEDISQHPNRYEII